MNLIQSQKGQGLIEVLLAIAILGVVAVSFLTALATASKAIIVADERTTAESLARSEMEYIKNSPYDDTNNPPQYSLDPDITIPDSYTPKPVIMAVRLDPEGNGTGNDDGIQQITVEVYHQGNLILSTTDYKVNRGILA
jgi:prepilin-type N-terminal cleavage/methylation domain-containing protein